MSAAIAGANSHASRLTPQEEIHTAEYPNQNRSVAATWSTIDVQRPASVSREPASPASKHAARSARRVANHAPTNCSVRVLGSDIAEVVHGVVWTWFGRSVPCVVQS